MDDREMREQRIFVYSQRRPAAVDKLLDIARRDPDAEMEEGALLAGTERGSPGGQGAPGHHRTAVGELIMPRILPLAALLALLPAALGAQSLARRVEAAGDGTVRLSFASRPGVCGTGTSITIDDDGDGDWESDCERGPVRVSLRISGRGSPRRDQVAPLAQAGPM
jgi:hypothetical protein